MKRYTLEFGAGLKEDPEGEWVRWEDLVEFTSLAADHAIKMDEFKRTLDAIAKLLKETKEIDF